LRVCSEGPAGADQGLLLLPKVAEFGFAWLVV
jgi:hypothetical protein